MTKLKITKALVEAATRQELQKLAIKLVEENIQLRQEIEKLSEERTYDRKK